MHYQYRPFHIAATQATAAAIGNNVATTSSTTITAGNGVVVTPASMQNITVGRRLDFNGGTGSPEDVQVTAVTATTFTANFQNNHSGNYTISSSRTVDLGEFVVNTLGSSDTITLYDGHPSATLPGTAIAVIEPASGQPTRLFDVRCNQGLFYTATTTGTFGDYTVTYHDRSA